jgi:hypothetical protein
MAMDSSPTFGCTVSPDRSGIIPDSRFGTEAFQQAVKSRTCGMTATASFTGED